MKLHKRLCVSLLRAQTSRNGCKNDHKMTFEFKREIETVDTYPLPAAPRSYFLACMKHVTLSFRSFCPSL